MRTEEALTVVWDGDFVPGVIFYGLRSTDGRCGTPEFPASAWPEGVERREGRLHNGDWEVLVWDVAISRWPSQQEWLTMLRTTLERLRDAGAVVTWCAPEGAFADPPNLFDPAWMSGGVYAAWAPNTGFVCTARLGNELQTLSDDQLRQLRDVATPVWSST